MVLDPQIGNKVNTMRNLASLVERVLSEACNIFDFFLFFSDSDYIKDNTDEKQKHHKDNTIALLN